MKLKSSQVKWVVVIAAGTYLYLKFKEGKDDGKMAGFKINPHLVVDAVLPWLGIEPFLKPVVGHMTKKFLDKVAKEKGDVIDAKYRRVR